MTSSKLKLISFPDGCVKIYIHIYLCILVYYFKIIYPLTQAHNFCLQFLGATGWRELGLGGLYHPHPLACTVEMFLKLRHYNFEQLQLGELGPGHTTEKTSPQSF